MIPYLIYKQMTRNQLPSTSNAAMSGESARPESPPSPPSPSASFYDMSDDEEGDYNTILHTKSERGVKLLFSKSKVYVHPTKDSKANIPGFLALLQQKSPAPTERPGSSASAASSKAIASSSLLLAWVPEKTLSSSALESYVKVDLSETSSPPKVSYLVPAPPQSSNAQDALNGYAFSIPVSNIYSLNIRPPNAGWWFGSVIVNPRGGASYPPLFFHDSESQSTILQRKKLAKNMDPFGEGGQMFWGGDEMLRWLKRYINVERSGADPNVYLIEPSAEDKLNFGKSLEPASKDKDNQRENPLSPFQKTMKEAGWNFMTAMASVTAMAKRASQVVAENRNLPQSVQNILKSHEVQNIQEDFDSARLYLARWAMAIAEQSERERKALTFTSKDVSGKEDSSVGSFEILELESLELKEKRNPVTLKEWNGWFDDHGRLLISTDEVKERIFHGGLDPDDGVRKDAWLFLLGVYDWDSSHDERQAMMNSKRDEYIRLKGKWWDRLVEGAGTLEEREWWREQKGRIEKDVHRTDRNVLIFAGEDIPHPDPDSPFADQGTNVHLEQLKDLLLSYNEYNTELGYVQGMSDLLAPIYAVEQDDAAAFWGFVGFMERMERNFLRDQSGMRTQLSTLNQLVQVTDPQLHRHLQKHDSTNFFFFFRMLLVWFKREFSWNDVLSLWERLWTDYYSGQFIIFFALAVLRLHRENIMAREGFDQILRYVNDLSGAIQLERTLTSAESLFRTFQRRIESYDKGKNFPAPSTMQPESSSAASPPRSPPSAGPSKGKKPSSADPPDEEEVEITPELRALLSRMPPRVKKSEP